MFHVFIRGNMRRNAVALAATITACALPLMAIAQEIRGVKTDDTTPVVVVVKIPKPWYALRFVVLSRMRDAIPQYENIPGLAYKAFSIAQKDGQYGGIYYWKDRASAHAWFNPAWFERVEKQRGAKADVRYFDAPVALDNTPDGALSSSDSDAVSTLVTIATPDGIDRERLITKFKAAVPVYQKAGGLLRKYFIITDDGKFGGIYLWSDQAAAQQWFSDAWHQRVRETYGADASIEWFDAPILLPSKAASNRIAMVRPTSGAQR
jgi:hypothetical protein